MSKHNNNEAARVTFENAGTFEGVTEWWVAIDGDNVGEMTRERPTTWHGNGVGGLVRDRKAPWIWCAMIDGKAVDIPDGSTLREAKRLVTIAAS